MGDLNGDHCADIIGFGDAGVYSATSNGDGTFAPATFILAAMGYNDGWRIENHPRLAADMTGDGMADLVGFGDDGVWVSVSGGSGASSSSKDSATTRVAGPAPSPLPCRSERGSQSGHHRFRRRRCLGRAEQRDGSFQPAAFVLADFGYHGGPVVQKITIDFHTLNDDLNDDSMLHVFVKNRSSDSSDSGGARPLPSRIFRPTIGTMPIGSAKIPTSVMPSMPARDTLREQQHSTDQSSCGQNRYRSRSCFS